MNKKNNIKINTAIFSFIIVFLLLYPLHEDCLNKNCFILALLAAIIFSSNKLSEYDFFKGEAFYGFNTFNIAKVKSLSEDSSKQNKIIRFSWFFTLLLTDALIVFVIITKSWLFN